MKVPTPSEALKIYRKESLDVIDSLKEENLTERDRDNSLFVISSLAICEALMVTAEQIRLLREEK